MLDVCVGIWDEPVRRMLFRWFHPQMIVILSLESGFNVLISRQLYIKEEMVVIGSFSSMLPNFVKPNTINALIYRYGVVVSG